jgi:hypothetical protein
MLDCYRRNSQFFYNIYSEIGMDFEPQIVVTGQKHSLVWTLHILLLQILGSNMVCCNCKTLLFCQNFTKSSHHPSKQGSQRWDRKDACACERKVMQ